MAKYRLRSETDSLGGVIVIDLSRTNDAEYVKEVAGRLKDARCLVVVLSSGNARTGHNIYVKDEYVSLNHEYVASGVQQVHVHKFYFNGTYKRDYTKYNFQDNNVIEALQAEVAELKNKLEQITIETNE